MRRNVIIFLLLWMLIGGFDMARGLPDYGNPEYGIAAVAVDSSEIIPFSKGFARMDALGRVIWVDSFDAGLGRWEISAAGAGSTPYLTVSNGRMLGSNPSVVLDPGAENGTSKMTLDFTIPNVNRIGIEFPVYFEINPGRLTIFFGASNSNGVTKYLWLYVDETTGVVYYHRTGGFTAVYTPAAVSYMRNKWIVIRVVVDIVTGEAVRLWIGDISVDLTGIALDNGSTTLPNTMHCNINILGEAGTKIEPVNIGYVIITVDEP